MDYGITRIYSPDDGRCKGLAGTINDLVRQSDFRPGDHIERRSSGLATRNPLSIARLISLQRILPISMQPCSKTIHTLARNRRCRSRV